MPGFALYFLFTLIVAIGGFAVGWLLRSKLLRPSIIASTSREHIERDEKKQENAKTSACDDSPADSDKQQPQEIMARLQELATRMAADVDAHNSCVREISDELSETKSHSSEDIVTAVAKIIDANEQMERRLESAEEKLMQQARQIKTQAAQARTDALTLLANRRAFDDELEQCIEAFRQRRRPVSVMMLDIDHFKKFNDTHGHQAGDQVLCDVARTLRKSVDHSTVVARYGGEEFAIIFPGMTATTARSLAERARKTVSQASFSYENQTLQVTLSAGLAELRSGEEAAIFLRRADKALYASKEAGRDCGHWHDGGQCLPIAPTDQNEKSPSKVNAPRLEALPPAPDSGEGKDFKNDDHDPTEGMSNQMALLDDLQRRIAAWKRDGKTLSVMLIQVDHFQRIVNHQGRDVADLVLRSLKQFIKAVIRDMDHAARFDDDTFALILPTANESQAAMVAERFRQAILRFEMPRGGNGRRYTVSIGLTEVKQGDDSLRMLERAEASLDAAIEHGRNCCYLHTGRECLPAEAETATAR